MLKVVQGHTLRDTCKHAWILAKANWQPLICLGKKKSHSLHTRWKYCLLNCVLQRCCLDADQPKIKNSDGENLSNHYGKPFCNTEPIRESFRLVHREVSMSRVSDLMGKSNGVIHFNILCYSWNESPTMHQCWCWETLPSPSKWCSSAHTFHCNSYKDTFDASTLLVRTG